ncbi:MAG: metal-dependent hydrolase, partial [Candidatus Acidiferrales bacterium]
MDPVTHGLASLALARVAQKRLPRYGTSMLVVSGVAADLDYLSYFGGAAAFLRFHRTLLHSILGSALIACVTAAAFFALSKAHSRKRESENPTSMRRELTFGLALFVCAIGAASHILLDLVSGIGVQLFWPFRAGWQGWDLLTNLDPWILVLLILALLLPELFRLVSDEIGEKKGSSRGRGAAIAALSLLVVYIGARADLHSKAINLLTSREYHGRPPLAASAFPLPSTPFGWRGVVSTDATVEELRVSLFPGAEFDPDRSFTRYKPDPSAALEAGRRTQAAKTFLAYAAIPFASVNHIEEGYRFELRDLRFAPNDASPENIVARADFNSSLQIQLEELR